MSRCRYIIGDVFEVLADMPNNSVDLVLTSPPFLALRSYLPDDHPDKEKELGQEPTPAEFIDMLLRLTAEWDRVLTPYGSIAVELGDTYSGSGGAGGDYSHDGLRAGQATFDGSAKKTRTNPGRAGTNRYKSDGHAKSIPARERSDQIAYGEGWPEAKSACLIPELFRVALAYGMNPLTGEPSPSGRWKVRNTVTWVRPNPPVGALGDKYRPATSDLVIACKAGDRWFDLDAVRQAYSENSHARVAKANGDRQTRTAKTAPDGNRDTLDDVNNDGKGAPPLDWWKISAKGYSGSHYAVFPPELCTIPIESMCPREVCTECGEPRRRTTSERPPHSHPPEVPWAPDCEGCAYEPPKGEWSDCDCDAPHRPGVVLDPFGGSGTTGMVATGHGREAILIDLDERNLELARERVGPMFFDEEVHAP